MYGVRIGPCAKRDGASRIISVKRANTLKRKHATHKYTNALRRYRDNALTRNVLTR